MAIAVPVLCLPVFFVVVVCLFVCFFNQYLLANPLICFILQRKAKCTRGVQDMEENLVKDT